MACCKESAQNTLKTHECKNCLERLVYILGLRICKARLMNLSLHKVDPEQESGARKSCPEQQYEQKNLWITICKTLSGTQIYKSVRIIILQIWSGTNKKTDCGPLKQFFQNDNFAKIVVQYNNLKIVWTLQVQKVKVSIFLLLDKTTIKYIALLHTLSHRFRPSRLFGCFAPIWERWSWPKYRRQFSDFGL